MIRLDLVDENYFKKEDGTYDKEGALLFGGRAAGICYNKEGYNALVNENVEKTLRRVDMTLSGGHHSVYGHSDVILNIQKIPKILAMVINNEHEYNTSEKSARYTPVTKTGSPVITEKEEELYAKWMEIFNAEMTKKYGDVFDSKKINKLAQENARYLVTVFMDTQMLYKTSLRQINYLASFMKRYIDTCDKSNAFESKLASSMQEFISELERLNLLDERLMRNEKNRSISLFSDRFDSRREYFGDVYLTKYEGSFAQLAQAQRHRTLDYEIRLKDDGSFYVPPIIASNKKLSKEWLADCEEVRSVYPQGMLVDICESGTYENFILKCKERLCSAAQLEIMRQTRDTILKYQAELERTGHPLKDDIVNYTKGARCTFKDYTCPTPCGFKEGIKLTRKI